MEQEFKPGDLVLCISSESTFYINVGTVYVVSLYTETGFVRIHGREPNDMARDGGGFMPFRFKNLGPASELERLVYNVPDSE